MATLPDGDRAAAWANLMRRWSANGETIGVTKDDLRAAVNALDDYLDTNAAAINSALPIAARTNLTVAQKALLLQYVVARRYLMEV